MRDRKKGQIGSNCFLLVKSTNKSRLSSFVFFSRIHSNTSKSTVLVGIAQVGTWLYIGAPQGSLHTIIHGGHFFSIFSKTNSQTPPLIGLLLGKVIWPRGKIHFFFFKTPKGKIPTNSLTTGKSKKRKKKVCSGFWLLFLNYKQYFTFFIATYFQKSFIYQN